MNIAKEYRNYRLFSRMQQIKKSFSLVYYLIYTVHLVCLSFLMMLSMHPQMEKSGIFIQKIIDSVMNHYLRGDIVDIVGLGSIGLSVVSTVILAIRLKMQTNYDQVHEYEKIDLTLFYASVAIRALLQLTIYISTLGFVHAFKTKGYFVFGTQITIPIIVHIYYNYKVQTVSLYSYFTIPIVFFITAFESPFSYIFLMTVSIYLILTCKQTLKKIYFAIAILLAVFVLKNQFLLKQVDGSDTQMPFVYIAVLILLLPIIVYKLKSQITLATPLDIIETCYETLNELKAEMPHSQLRFHQFYPLYQNVVSLALSNKDEKSPQVQNILEKQYSKVTKKDFFQLLQIHLDKQCKKSTQDNILLHIQRLKVRMRLSYSMEQTIKEMHSLTQEFQRSNKKNSNEFYEIFDQTMKKFAIFYNETLYSAYVVYLNNLHENFESKTHDLMQKLANFWKEISQHQLMRTNLDRKFQEVLELEHDLEIHYQKMKNLQTFQTEKKALNIIRTIFNVYEDQQKTASLSSQKIDEQSKINYSFIIIENDIIKFISKDLLKFLGEKSSLAYENTDKRSLFGDDFSIIVENMIRNIDATNQNEFNTVPIICKDGYVELKKIRVVWYPSLESQNRTIIKFKTQQQLSEQPFLIYHFKSDTIKYFNSQFITYFQIEKQKFHFQMTNYQFFFNQLFLNTDVPIEDIKSYLKDGNTIRCKIYLKNYVKKGAVMSIPVEITVFKCLYVDDQPAFCLMKIMKSKEKKLTGIMTNPEGEILIENKNKTKAILGKVVVTNENIWAKKYEKQQFFCKIPNNYESKITEKQAQLQESGRLVYRHFIHLLFGLMFVTVMVFWIMDIKFLSDRITSYRKQMVAMQNTSEQFALLYQAYSLAIKRYHIQNYPEQTKLVKGFPGFVYQKMYEIAEQSSLDEFLRRYLTQINYPPNSQIQYDLKFTHFGIQTDTTKSTLMDFAQHIKRNLAVPELDFLLRNYNSLRNLTIHYESAFKYNSKVEEIVSSTQIYFWILVVSSILSVGAILYVLWKIQAAIEIVYALIEMISVKQLKESLAIFDEKKKCILNSFDPSIKQIQSEIKQKQHQRSHSSISDVKSQTSKSDVPHSEYSLNIKDEITPRKNEKVVQQEINENQITQGKTLLDKFHNRNQEPKRKLIDESLMAKLNRKSFFIVILLALNIVFIIDYNSVKNQKTGILEFFDIKQKLYVSLLHIKRQEVDAPIGPTFLHYFKNNSMAIENYNLSKLDLVIQVSDEMYFKEITNFGQTARITLLSNMCNIAGKYTQGSPKPCQKYLNGIVTKGFGQTFDLFMQNAKKVKQQSLSEFGLYTCTQQKCPPYYEHEFVSILMGQTIRYIIFNLNKQMNRIFDVLMESTKLKIVYKSIGMLLALILYFGCDRSLRNRCKRAIKYFRIVPKEVMCSTKLTTFMRKQKVLSRFDIL